MRCLCIISLVAGAASMRAQADGKGEEAKAFDQYAGMIKAAARQAGRPGVKFDENFFSDKCDLSEYAKSRFESSQYQLSEAEEYDDKKWTDGFNCESPGDGRDPEIVTNFTGSRYDCAKVCSGKSAAHAGQVICCEHHPDRKQCETRVGWMSMSESNYGTNHWNPQNWFRNPKAARLFFTAPEDGYVPVLGGDEMTAAEKGKSHMRQLIEEVNHMSIDGILDHMLSFYVCLRWVPDEEFVSLAKHELEHVSVDQETPALEKVTRQQILAKYLRADLVPLRCGTAVNVHHIEEIEKLVAQFNDSASDMNELYRFSQRVQEAAGTGVLATPGSRIKGVEDAMYYDPAKGADSVFVADMRARARKPEALPWSTFLRPSNRYAHHRSHPKNRFMLCFGPRVASFPHKRSDGEHFLADTNMAGCNGFWDVASVLDHMERIKKLFAPEMCFEHELRKELKTQFLRTFVAMNEEFEKAMAGVYTQRLHDLDPTKSKKLDLLSANLTEYQGVGKIGGGKANSKYRHVAGLVAKAHSKWVICKARDTVEGAFGSEDNFFRDPRSYEKWIGKQGDDTVPECKTLDDTTGCVKCVVAVKDEHRCHVRLNVKLKDIYTAINERKFPFLQSSYQVREEVKTEHGESKIEVVTKRGGCLVRKSVATANAAKKRGLESVRFSYFHVNDTDTIVRLDTAETPSERDSVKSVYRMDVLTRREQLAEFMKSEGNWNDTAVDDLAMTDELGNLIDGMSEERYSDRAGDFAKKFIFTDEVPELTNRPAHKVDYFVSCPCSKSDFSPNEYFANFGNQGMAEYFNR